MENRMDRQPLSSEHELPTPPVLLQEPHTLAPDLRLITRVMRWTLLTGMMLGCSLTLFGIEEFHTPLQISDLVIAHLLGPLWSIAFGATGVLYWNVQRLRSQLAALRRNADGLFSRRLFGLLGIEFIGLGCVVLLAPYLPQDVAQLLISVGGPTSLMLIFGIDVYLTFQSNRRRKKRG